MGAWRGWRLGHWKQATTGQRGRRAHAPNHLTAEPTLYLVDTSVWIPLLRGSPADSSLAQRVAALIAADAVAITGFVRFEVLRGARDEQHLGHLRTMLDGLH